MGLDATVVNIALPSIRRDSAPPSLAAAVDDRRLLADARQPAAAVGLDGRPLRPSSRVFQLGLALFTLRLAAVLDSAPTVQGWLIAFRVVQAIGGSMLNPVAMSIISQHLHRPRASGPRRSASGAA